MPAAIPPFKRLLSNYKVNELGCWIWQGSIASNYGQIKVFGKMRTTHKYSYELHKGNIDIGFEVMHLCNNKLCINPDHLKKGTHKENMQQAIKDKLLDHSKIKYRGVGGVERSQSKQVFVKGKAYGSLNEAEKKLELGSGTVAYWIKNKPNVARLISKEEYINLINK
jgi:hypothetical protein